MGNKSPRAIGLTKLSMLNDGAVIVEVLSSGINPGFQAACVMGATHAKVYLCSFSVMFDTPYH